MEIITETLDAIVGAAVERTNDEHDSASKLHATTKRMHEQEVSFRCQQRIYPCPDTRNAGPRAPTPK
jgi:hypothetical protein